MTALAILKLPSVGTWPETVDVLDSPTGNRRSKRGVLVHRSEFDADDLLEWEGFHVTNAARTIADLARAGEFMAAVVALEHALGPRATPLQVVTKDQVRSVVDDQGPWGRTRAMELIDFADERAASHGGDRASAGRSSASSMESASTSRRNISASRPQERPL